MDFYEVKTKIMKSLNAYWQQLTKIVAHSSQLVNTHTSRSLQHNVQNKIILLVKSTEIWIQKYQPTILKKK